MFASQPWLMAPLIRLGSRVGILGYVTGERPLPECGDSATGERLPGGSSAGGGSLKESSDDVEMVVTSLPPEARARVRFRVSERRLEELRRGFCWT